MNLRIQNTIGYIGLVGTIITILGFLTAKFALKDWDWRNTNSESSYTPPVKSVRKADSSNFSPPKQSEHIIPGKPDSVMVAPADPDQLMFDSLKRMVSQPDALVMGTDYFISQKRYLEAILKMGDLALLALDDTTAAVYWYNKVLAQSDLPGADTMWNENAWQYIHTMATRLADILIAEGDLKKALKRIITIPINNPELYRKYALALYHKTNLIDTITKVRYFKMKDNIKLKVIPLAEPYEIGNEAGWLEFIDNLPGFLAHHPDIKIKISRGLISYNDFGMQASDSIIAQIKTRCSMYKIDESRFLPGDTIPSRDMYNYIFIKLSI